METIEGLDSGIELIAEMLLIEVEHLGEDAFAYAPLTDELIANLAMRDMGLVPVLAFTSDEMEFINADQDLHAMYRTICRGTERVETLPDLDALQDLVNADAIEITQPSAERAA